MFFSAVGPRSVTARSSRPFTCQRARKCKRRTIAAAASEMRNRLMNRTSPVRPRSGRDLGTLLICRNATRPPTPPVVQSPIGQDSNPSLM